MLNSKHSYEVYIPASIKKAYKLREHLEQRLLKDIYSFHAPIAHLFKEQSGTKFMFLESEILIDVLLELNRKGITALPVHDCVLVKTSAADTSKDIMLRVFNEHTGVVGSVDVEHL
jgi:predicted transcriptional regulator